MKKYKFIACGGTFDLFHKGHREFLRFVISQGEKVLIGITSDKYIKNSKLPTSHLASLELRGASKTPSNSAGKQNSKLIEPYERRRMLVEEFLQSEKCLDSTEIISIDDVYGPTLNPDLAIDAIIVTKDSQDGAQHINNMRKERGLQEVTVVVAPLIVGEDGQIISSSRIRQGEIDREGKLYIRPEWLMHALHLPESVRLELKQPVGTLVKQGSEYMENLNGKQTVTVGDVVTKTCNNKSFNQVLSVVDFVVQREKQYVSIGELGFSGNEKVLTVTNPAGFITPQLFQSVQAVFREINKNPRFVICVDGEEDLAVLPVLLAAPLGFVVLYGQPHEGVVQIFVTEESKNKARYFVSRFNS